MLVLISIKIELNVIVKKSEKKTFFRPKSFKNTDGLSLIIKELRFLKYED